MISLEKLAKALSDMDYEGQNLIKWTTQGDGSMVGEFLGYYFEARNEERQSSGFSAWARMSHEKHSTRLGSSLYNWEARERCENFLRLKLLELVSDE